MFTRFVDWLDRQPPQRRRLYGAFIALTLLTLPCYAGGLLLRLLNVAPPPPGQRAPTAQMVTATPSPEPGPSPTFRLIPSVVPPPTWTPGYVPPEATDDGSPEPEGSASPEVTPETTATLASEPTAAPEPTALPTAEEPSPEPASPEPPTAAPQPPPTDPPTTPIGGFTPAPPPP